MQELLDKLQAEAQLDPGQAQRALDVVKNFTKQRFPMFADAIDKLFESEEVSGKDDFLEG